MKRLLNILLVLALTISVNAQPVKIGTIASAYQSLREGLVSYWKLDESSGTLTDSQGSNTGTNYGATYSATGKINTAMSFATDDYISAGNPASLQLGSTGSISAWFYATNTDAAIVSKANMSTGRNGYSIILGNDGLVWGAVCNASTYLMASSASSASLNAWHHVVFTWTASGMAVILDGVAGTATSSLTPVSNVYDLYIGSDPSGGGFLTGTIDEVAIWNRSLTSAEIAILYNSASGRAHPFIGY